MKNWKVTTLIRRALTQTIEDDTYWKCVHKLQLNATDEVFDAAAEQCRKRSNASRTLGANILGQLGSPSRPYREPSLKILWSLLRAVKSPPVLDSILVAIGHLQEETDTRNIRLIVGFANHESELVRFGVVNALLSKTDPRAIATLIRLSRDQKSDVRDWATFGLGSMISADSPRIRRALLARLDDPDCDTRREAIMGLARRKLPVIRSWLLAELQSESPTSFVFEAAIEFGDPTLLPLLEKHPNSIDD